MLNGIECITRSNALGINMPITLSSARIEPSSALAFENWMAAANLLDAADAPVTLTDHLRKIQNYGARLHFNRNELIFNQCDPAHHVYRIISGAVRLCRYTPDGRRSIVDFLLSGGLMGFIENQKQPIAAEAVSDVTLIAYPGICFERLAAENEAVRAQLLCHLSQTLAAAQQHLVVLGCQKARERLASFLLRLADQLDLASGERLDLSMSRQDIADHLGLTIETISRTVAALRGEGLILVPNAHQIVLRDVAALRALAAEG
jgi:CRP/FNR family nitrogen fixation transcriptional regulator